MNFKDLQRLIYAIAHGYILINLPKKNELEVMVFKSNSYLIGTMKMV